jgi:hypothetical protein
MEIYMAYMKKKGKVTKTFEDKGALFLFVS